MTTSIEVIQPAHTDTDMARDDHDTTNAALKYLASLSAESSKKTMRNILDWIAREFFTATGLETVDWAQIRNKHLTLVKATLERDGKAMSTVNLYIAAMKGVAGAAFDLGQIDAGVLMRIQRIKCKVPTDQRIGRAFEHKEIMRLFASFDEERNPARRARDEALVGLLVFAGLRMVDTQRLMVGDVSVDFTKFTVHRKGNKVQELGINPTLAEKLRTWVAVRGTLHGPLICRIGKGTVIKPALGMSNTSYRKIFLRYVDLACVGTASPHDARRTFATVLDELGVPPQNIQYLLGHAKFDTTMRYLLRTSKNANKTIRELNILKRPYHRKEKEEETTTPLSWGDRPHEDIDDEQPEVEDTDDVQP